MTTTAQRLYTVAEAAKQLGTGTTYIYSRLDDGTLPYVDLNAGGKRSKRRIRASDLDAFIEERTFTDAPESHAA